MIKTEDQTLQIYIKYKTQTLSHKNNLYSSLEILLRT